MESRSVLAAFAVTILRITGARTEVRQRTARRCTKRNETKLLLLLAYPLLPLLLPHYRCHLLI